MADEAMAAAHASGSTSAAIHALNTKGLCSLDIDAEAALGYVRQSMDLARAEHDMDGLVRGYLNLSDALHLLGRTREAWELLLEGRGRLEKTLGRHATWLELQRAEMAFNLGYWDEADSLMPPELARGRQGMTRVFFEMRRAELELARGDNVTARHRLEVARDLVARSYEPQWHAPITSMIAGLERRERHLDAARAAIRVGLEKLTSSGALQDGARLARIYYAATGVEADAAQQARDLGHADDEAAAIAAAREFARRTREAAEMPFASAVPEAQGYALVAEGEAANAAGTPDPQVWARAAELWASIDRPFRVARARWMEAQARIAIGDRAGAGPAAAEAVVIGRRLGAGWLVDEVTALARRGRVRLGTLAAAPQDARAGADASDGPDPAAELGLTPRERDVLVLVAEGCTNREIGERLYMAEKTASVHVSRILAKLDVRSRTEAAAVAHRLGIQPAGTDRLAVAR
jgi:DNA-binding CsgD family transcriptional regulator